MREGRRKERGEFKGGWYRKYVTEEVILKEIIFYN